jgi:hypothetical protein
MKKIFNLFFIAIALIAVSMTSCKKELNFNDVTESTHTIRIVDHQTGEAISGAKVKDGNGVVVATTGSDGMATYTQKVNDEMIFTVNANGYASMLAYDGTTYMCKLSAKLSGIATYTDESGNLKTIPSGTQLAVKTSSSIFVQRIYKTTVGSEGKFEFNNLPNGAGMLFDSPIIIENDTYATTYYSSGFTAGQTVTMAVSYFYVNNDLPFAVITRPGHVKTTDSIVIAFNKEVDTVYSNNYLHIYGYYYYGDFTANWSNNNKTLTILPDNSWGTPGNTLNVYLRCYTPVDNAGSRQSVDENFYVRIVE